MFTGHQEDYVQLLEGRKTAGPELHTRARLWAENELALLEQCLAHGDLSVSEMQDLSDDADRLKRALSTAVMQ